MKKEYKKPQVFMENFALTESIAACGGVNGANIVTRMNCDNTNGQLEAEDQGFVDMGEPLFVSKADCMTVAAEEEFGDGWKICYHTAATGEVNIFNS